MADNPQRLALQQAFHAAPVLSRDVRTCLEQMGATLDAADKKKFVLVKLWQSLHVSKTAAESRALLTALSTLLELSFSQRLRLRLYWRLRPAKALAQLEHWLRVDNYLPYRSNQALQLDDELFKQINQAYFRYQQYYRQGKNRSHWQTAMQECNQLFIALLQNPENPKLDLSRIKSNVLRDRWQRYQHSRDRRYKNKYQQLQQQLSQMRINPYLSWLKHNTLTLFGDGWARWLGYEPTTYRYLRTLFYLTDTATMTQLADYYFDTPSKAIDALNAEDKLNHFLRETAGFLTFLQRTSLKKHGYSNERKIRQILQPAIDCLSQWSHAFALKESLYPGAQRDIATPLPQFSLQKRKPLSYQETQQRKRQTRSRYLGKLALFLTCLGFGVLGLCVFWLSSPLFAVMFALGSVYSMYQLFRPSFLHSLYQVFVKGNFSHGLSFPGSQVVAFPATLAAMILASLVAGFSAISILTIPTLSITVGLLFAAGVFVSHFFTLTLLMRHTTLSSILAIEQFCQWSWRTLTRQGASAWVKQMTAYCISPILGSSKHRYQGDLSTLDIMLYASEVLLRIALWTSLITLALLLVFCVTGFTVSIWHSQTTALFRDYLLMAEPLSRKLSFVLSCFIAGSQEGYFNLQTFTEASQRLFVGIMDYLIVPIGHSLRKLCTNPFAWATSIRQRCHSANQWINETADSFVYNPWKSTFPLLNLVSTLCISTIAIGYYAYGNAYLLVRHSAFSLNLFGLPERITPRFALMAEQLSRMSCVSLILSNKYLNATPASLTLVNPPPIGSVNHHRASLDENARRETPRIRHRQRWLTPDIPLESDQNENEVMPTRVSVRRFPGHPGLRQRRTASGPSQFFTPIPSPGSQLVSNPTTHVQHAPTRRRKKVCGSLATKKPSKKAFSILPTACR